MIVVKVSLTLKPKCNLGQWRLQLLNLITITITIVVQVLLTLKPKCNLGHWRLQLSNLITITIRIVDGVWLTLKPKCNLDQWGLQLLNSARALLKFSGGWVANHDNHFLASYVPDSLIIVITV